MSSNERILAMHDLMEEVLQIQKETAKDPASMERVTDIITRSSELVEGSESANEIMMDARILHTGSQVFNSNVSSFDTHLTSFNEEDYAKGLIAFVRDRSNCATVEKSWSCLAPSTYHLFRRSQPVTYMIGSVSLEPVEVVDRERQERGRKVVGTTKTRLAESSESQENDAEEDSNIYEHILKSLVVCYKANGRKPVAYLDFIVDPWSYWQTVENIFYFSFLVRDGSVSMFLSEGLPVVEPVLKSSVGSGGGAGKGTNQFSFAFSMRDWRQCIDRFGITSAKIKPFRRRT